MLLVGNGKLITRDNANPLFENGAVVIENGIVKEVGDFKTLKDKYKDAEFIDAKGKLIMPGLINTHMHIYSAFARGMNLGTPPNKELLDILENLWWRLDKGLTLEDTKYSAYTTLLDCIKTGCTTVFDHHASPMHVTDSLFTIAGVSKELGIRANLCYEVSDRDGEDSFNRGVKENVDFIKYANKDDQDMIKGMFGMHASFTLSNNSLDKCVSAMAGIDAGYHIHVGEGIGDLHACLKEHGCGVVERLYNFKITGDKSNFIHCIFVSPREMEILKHTNTNVIHNPESNMGNACGCSPVIEMFKRGIMLGLGTDGYTADMFESLKVGNIIHKHHLCDSNVAWVEIPTMLNENNTKIAKKYFSKEAGVLKEGSFGDVIIVDYDPLTPLTANNINGHMTFGMSGRCVTDTIVGGKILMKNREILVADEAKIMAKSRELAKDLWKRI